MTCKRCRIAKPAENNAALCLRRKMCPPQDSPMDPPASCAAQSHPIGGAIAGRSPCCETQRAPLAIRELTGDVTSWPGCRSDGDGVDRLERRGAFEADFCKALVGLASRVGKENFLAAFCRPFRLPFRSIMGNSWKVDKLRARFSGEGATTTLTPCLIIATKDLNAPTTSNGPRNWTTAQ
jgi:hypothetical protein